MTAIEWTDETWNPTVGCTRVSPGCEHCYAERTAYRLDCMGKRGYESLVRTHPSGEARWTGKVTLFPERLDWPLRWRKPKRVFLTSMGDLFHEDVPDEFIDQVFGVMALAPQHTFQVLTKRPERMRSYLTDEIVWGRVEAKARRIYLNHTGGRIAGKTLVGPLANVWPGVSCENQKTADERIPLLLQTPAAVRFVSAEPLLEQIGLRSGDDFSDRGHGRRWLGTSLNAARSRGVDWVIVGGESGPGARPCDLEWIRSIVEQCDLASVPCFVKQLGAKPYEGHWEHDYCCDRAHEHPGQHPLHVDGPDGIARPLRDRKGGDPEEWSEDLRVREFPR